MGPRELERWREHWTLAEGARVVCRPIRPDDAAIEQAFLRGLSPESRHFRFMADIRELSPEMLARFPRISSPLYLALISLPLEGDERMPAAPLREREKP